MIGLILSALAGLLTLLVRPGVNVVGRDSSPPGTLPTDTGITFAAGILERGRTDKYIKIGSWGEFLRKCGSRQSWSATLWDAVEAFYIFGGGTIYISRIVGPAAVRATVNLNDNAAAISLVATALGAGDWYNGLRLAVETDPLAAGSRRIRVTHATDASIREESPYLATQQALVDWFATNSDLISLVVGASALMPVNVAAAALLLGADDRAAITDTERTAALDRFNVDLGPGQVAIPGAVTSTAWAAILTHARDRNRSAVLDYPDTGVEATLTTLAGTARALGRNGAAFAGWVRMTFGTGSKLVAPSLCVCGRIAAHDAKTNGWGQNKPVAGRRRGRLDRAIGVSQDWLDSDARTRLNAAGVNLIRQRPYGVVIYGWRTLVDEAADPGWTNFGHRRLQTGLFSKADEVMEDYVFDEIDGEGKLLGQVNGSLKGRVVLPYYKAGSLYGATPELAFRIDTDSVNTPATIQNKELHASITVVESEFAEEVTIEVVKHLITEGVDS